MRRPALPRRVDVAAREAGGEAGADPGKRARESERGWLLLGSALMVWLIIEGFRPVEAPAPEGGAGGESRAKQVAPVPRIVPEVADEELTRATVATTLPPNEDEQPLDAEGEEPQDVSNEEEEKGTDEEPGSADEGEEVEAPLDTSADEDAAGTAAVSKEELERRMELAQRELRKRTAAVKQNKFVVSAVRVISEGDELAACCPAIMTEDTVCVCDESVDLVVVRGNATNPYQTEDQAPVLKLPEEVTEEDEPVADPDEVAAAVAEVRRQAAAGWLEQQKEEEARALEVALARQKEVERIEEEEHVQYMRLKHERIRKKQLDRQRDVVNGFLEELDTRVEGRLHKLKKEYAKMEIMRSEWREEVKALNDGARGEGPADVQLRAKMERAMAKAEREVRERKAAELASKWENWDAKRVATANDAVDGQRSGLFGGKSGWRWVAGSGGESGGQWQFIDGRAPDLKKIRAQQRRKEREQQLLREKYAPQHSHMIRVEETWHVAKPGTGRYGTGSSMLDQVAVEEANAQEARVREQANQVHILPCSGALIKMLPGDAAERMCQNGHVRPLPEHLEKRTSSELKRRKKYLDADVQSLID